MALRTSNNPITAAGEKARIHGSARPLGYLAREHYRLIVKLELGLALVLPMLTGGLRVDTSTE